MHIHNYNAEDVLPSSHDKEITLHNLVEIWKHSTLEEAEEPEP